MARRNKPKTPEQIMAEAIARKRQDYAAAGLDPASVGLPAFENVVVERAGKKAGTNRIWYSNVFRLLLERKTITTSHYEAAYQLATAWAIWKGLDGKGEAGELVDGGKGCAELVTDRMIAAGRDVARAMREVSPIDRAILEAFMVATVEEDRPMQWRGILERLGLKSRDKQPQYVVTALEALRVHYQEPGRVAA